MKTLTEKLADALRGMHVDLANGSPARGSDRPHVRKAKEALAEYDARPGANPPVDPDGAALAPLRLSLIDADTITADNGTVIAHCTGYQRQREAHARRLIACYNACAGIPTETLERAGFVKLDDDPLYELVQDDAP